MAKKKRAPIQMNLEEIKYHRNKFKAEMELRRIWRQEVLNKTNSKE